jgi:hypothetical protein
MIYIDAQELEWSAYTTSWLDKKFEGNDEGAQAIEFHRNLIEKWVVPICKFKVCLYYDMKCSFKTNYIQIFMYM